MTDIPIAARLVRALREGVRESLTLASALGMSVTRVNDGLHSLRDRCAGCLELVQPDPNEPRLVVTVRDWRALQRLVMEEVPTGSSPRASDHHVP
jgi:hypothetical protein